MESDGQLSKLECRKSMTLLTNNIRFSNKKVKRLALTVRSAVSACCLVAQDSRSASPSPPRLPSSLLIYVLPPVSCDMLLRRFPTSAVCLNLQIQKGRRASLQFQLFLCFFWLIIIKHSLPDGLYHWILARQTFALSWLTDKNTPLISLTLGAPKLFILPKHNFARSDQYHSLSPNSNNLHSITAVSLIQCHSLHQFIVCSHPKTTVSTVIPSATIPGSTSRTYFG